MKNAREIVVALRDCASEFRNILDGRTGNNVNSLRRALKECTSTFSEAATDVERVANEIDKLQTTLAADIDKELQAENERMFTMFEEINEIIVREGVAQK